MNYLSLIRSYPRYLGFGFLHMFASNIGQTFLIALFIPHIREAFGLSKAAMGSWYGLLTMASAGVLFFTGPLIDRVNLRWFSVGTACTVATGCLLLGLAPVWAVAWVGLFLIRHGGQGLMAHTAATSMSRYFTVARGKALGIAGLGIAVGKASLPVLFAALLAQYPWQGVYLGVVLVYLLLFIPTSLRLVTGDDDIQSPKATQGETTEHLTTGELNWGRAEVLRHPYFWLILPLNLMPPCLGTGIFFFQAEMAASKGWSMTLYATCFAAYGVTATATSFGIGPLIDRWGAARMLPWALLPMMAGIWAISSIPSILGGYLLMGALGICFGAVANLRSAMWAEVYGRQNLGSIKSMVGTVLICSTAVAPALGGWLLDGGTTVPALLRGCLWLCAGATAVALFARPPQKYASETNPPRGPKGSSLGP